jgi:PII-like signaling protein
VFKAHSPFDLDSFDLRLTTPVVTVEVVKTASKVEEFLSGLKGLITAATLG